MSKTKKEPILTTATIPYQELPPMIPPAWTVNEVLHHIPEEWRNSTIAVNDGLGRIYQVRRVVLCVNHSGSRVIVISAEEQQIRKWE